ncbi:MAG: peptidoglycan DD-metalloendopeptidase family protein [Bacteroidales bacterium]
MKILSRFVFSLFFSFLLLGWFELPVTASERLLSISSWKLPLPAGKYKVVQGDDSNPNPYTHKGNNPSLRCAVDFILENGDIDGKPALAPVDGKVIKVDYQENGAGNYVNILHDEDLVMNGNVIKYGVVSQYMHFQDESILVKEGDRVRQGQQIARVGNTGKSTEPHLHFVVLTYKDGVKSDCVRLNSLDGNDNLAVKYSIARSTNQLIGSIVDSPKPKPIEVKPPLPTPVPGPAPKPKPNPVASQNSSSSCPTNSIESFLAGSPLAGKAATFIEKGQLYNVDPRFIVAIASAESSLGRRTCANYNGWGEMESGKCKSFSSWEDSIGYVSWHVGQKYLPIGQNTIPSFVYQKDSASGTCTSHCWCVSGCQNWIPNVSKAYQSMGGDPNTSVLTFSGCTKDSTPSNRAPAKPSLVEPSNKAEYTGQIPKLCAKENGDPDTGDRVSAYFFQIYESAQSWDSGWTNQACVTPSKLGSSGYKWRAKVKDTKDSESDWSDTWNFTIRTNPTAPVASPIPTRMVTAVPKPKVPAAPSLRSPNGQQHLTNTTDIGFSWNYSPDATEFFLEYWGGPYGTLNSGWINDTAYHIGTMWPGAYSWHVKARNGTGESNWSDTWTFSISQPSTTAPTLPPKPPKEVPTKPAQPLPSAIPTITLRPPTITPQPQFTGNIAPRASRNPDGINSGNAFDGNPSSYWVDGLGHRFTLKLSWGDMLPVSRIIVWDRPQSTSENNQINKLTVTLGNGVSKSFGMDSGGKRCIDIQMSSPQTINSVQLKADDASGNNGLGEVEIWIGQKTGGPTCSRTDSMP